MKRDKRMFTKVLFGSYAGNANESNQKQGWKSNHWTRKISKLEREAPILPRGQSSDDLKIRISNLLYTCAKTK